MPAAAAAAPKPSSPADGVATCRYHVQQLGCGHRARPREEAAARRKPDTRSRGLLAQRSVARISLMCAASRNLRPPNFTKGIFLHVNSTSRAALWWDVRNSTACDFSRNAGLAIGQDCLDDVVRLRDVVSNVDQQGRSDDGRSDQRFLVKRSAARSITALAAARIGCVER